MKKYLYFILGLFFVLFLISKVSSQAFIPGIVIEHFSKFDSQRDRDTAPGDRIKLINLPGTPKTSDIVDSMKQGKKVTLVFPIAPRATHAVRLVWINATSTFGTNADGQGVTFNDVGIYDPTSAREYTLKISYINDSPQTVYIEWGSNNWVEVQQMISVYITQSPINNYRLTPYNLFN